MKNKKAGRWMFNNGRQPEIASTFKVPIIFSNKLGLVSFFMLILFASIFLTNCESKTYHQGEILYQNFCANCHMEDGSGLKNIIPPLASADYVKNNQELLPCIIRNGQEGEITVNGIKYNSPMAGTNRLSPFEIANIINYINTAWGNDFGYAKFEEIKEILEECPYEYK